MRSECIQTWAAGAGPRGATRAAWRSAFAAGVLTLATFLLIPFLSALTPTPESMLRLVPADTVRLPVPPVEPPREQPREPNESRPLPKPRLAQERRLLPLNAVLNLDLALGRVVSGDFALDFGTTPDVITAIGDTVFEIADIDTPPVPLVRLRPIYPAEARMRHIEGSVAVEFIVGTDGKTRDVIVVNAEPSGIFTAQAVRAVSRWRFEPGTRGGKSVPVRVRQTVRFQLED